MSAEAAIYPTSNSVSNRFSTKPFEPNRQTNPKANPTIRSALLKNSAKPVKKKVSKKPSRPDGMDFRILANPSTKPQERRF
jgi:hypothetical protein